MGTTSRYVNDQRLVLDSVKSTSPRPSRLKMKHIKKILLKPFKKRGTPSESSAEFDRDSKGENSSRDLRADKHDGADLTITPDTKSNHGEGSQIANKERTIGDQQLPTLDISTLTARHDGGSATCEWGQL